MGVTFRYDDGGREAAGYKGETGDCGVRAAAIATGEPYKEVYKALFRLSGKTPRKGVARSTLNSFLKARGFEWTALMKIGTGCTTRLDSSELPRVGRYVLRLSRHYAAWIDGELVDTYDCSRDGTRCVYGFWAAPLER